MQRKFGLALSSQRQRAVPRRPRVTICSESSPPLVGGSAEEKNRDGVAGYPGTELAELDSDLNEVIRGNIDLHAVALHLQIGQGVAAHILQEGPNRIADTAEASRAALPSAFQQASDHA